MRARSATLASLLCVAGCASEGARAHVDLPRGRAPSEQDRVAREVGRLLGSDARASKEAEDALHALDAPGRAALAAHARRIPGERDPRWLHVLDEHGLLPPLSDRDLVALHLWEAARGGAPAVAKAQATLERVAVSDPEVLVEAIARPGPSRDLVALVLGRSHVTRAVPALVALYRDGTTAAERRAAADALGRLLGADARPPADADDAERAVEARRLLAILPTEKPRGAP
ncbi:MAG: hypothetical protein IT460_08110 [Planctomycetes bacterium]|nr:hypothetical protein [Planctomycetota bacterium]